VAYALHRWSCCSVDALQATTAQRQYSSIKQVSVKIRVCGDLQGTVLWLCSALRWVGLCCSCLLTLALCLYHIALRFLLRRLSLASCAAAPLLLQGRVVAGKGKQNMHRLQFLGPRETPFPSPAAESCHTHRLSTDLAQSSIRH